MELKEDSFKEAVGEGVSLVDFWAPWCGPCNMLTPIIKELEEELKDKVGVYKVNVDENPNVAGEYQVVSIPTVMIFKDGEVKETIVGVKDKSFYVEALEKVQSS